MPFLNLKPAQECERLHSLQLWELWNNPHSEVWGSESQARVAERNAQYYHSRRASTAPLPSLFHRCFNSASLWICSSAFIAALKHHPWPLTSANILLFIFFGCALVRPKWLVFLNQSSAGGAEVFLKHLTCSYGPLMEGQQKARKPNRIKSLSQEQRASVARYKYTLTSHTHAHTHKRHRQRSHRTQAPFTIISSVRTKESLW